MDPALPVVNLNPLPAVVPDNNAGQPAAVLPAAAFFQNLAQQMAIQGAAIQQLLQNPQPLAPQVHPNPINAPAPVAAQAIVNAPAPVPAQVIVPALAASEALERTVAALTPGQQEMVRIPRQECTRLRLALDRAVTAAAAEQVQQKIIIDLVAANEVLTGAVAGLFGVAPVPQPGIIKQGFLNGWSVTVNYKNKIGNGLGKAGTYIGWVNWGLGGVKTVVWDGVGGYFAFPILKIAGGFVSLAATPLTSQLNNIALFRIGKTFVKYTAGAAATAGVISVIYYYSGSISTIWNYSAVPAWDFLSPYLGMLWGAAAAGAQQIGVDAAPGVNAAINQANQHIETFIEGISVDSVASYVWSWVTWGGSTLLWGGVKGAVGVWNNSSWSELGLLSVAIGAYSTLILHALVGDKVNKIVNGYIEYLVLVAKESIGRPLLNMDEHYPIPIISPILRVFRKGFDQIAPPRPKPKPMFAPYIQNLVDRFLKAAPNLVQNGGTLQNLMLEGPPGTGKTLVANYIASRLGWAYKKVNGSNLLVLASDPKRNPVSELTKILDKIKYGRGQTVLFIDEAEIFLQDRNKIDTKDPRGQLRYEMLTAFMTYMEDDTFKTKCSVILATNRKDDIDAAVHSRVRKGIYIGPPDWQTRYNILSGEVRNVFESRRFLRGKVGTPDSLSPESLARITGQIGSMTGRTIRDMVNDLLSATISSNDGILTDKMVDDIVYEYVWLDRGTKGAVRKWRVFEIVHDFYYFKISWYTQKAISGLIKTLKFIQIQVRKLKDWAFNKDFNELSVVERIKLALKRKKEQEEPEPDDALAGA